MYRIEYFKINGRWLAYIFEDPEYWEMGDSLPEAIGKLIQLMVENTLLDNIEFKQLENPDTKESIAIMQNLNNRGLL